ncbi:glutamine--fructose-6-phosphate aminotransferase [Methanomicrobiaceae archaeon CYW5]|uniref:glutamine--fructose-6-phosphate transaminase (isomerizing) n=1 Tax=Methanovulcanius yangii TaxID=1789227 RepID=UPI0029C9E9B5|nr:glutamine--fructose-6-phosphate transaminase (isomerizing) [Methanovulcanius yangii]MBT8507880.1 glutamine--fructose-6-phosphate aminotransferase [Methanovulcanius yangii]
MCGIVGYVGWRNAESVLVQGLRALEYRGYDSYGLAISDGTLSVVKDAGRISDYRTNGVSSGAVGIGHTRWATHGVPSAKNAHPHTDCTGNFAIVHNGIIENYSALRAELLAAGHIFSSDTDSEVIAHLFEECYDGDLLGSLREVVARLEGSYAVLVISAQDDAIAAARNRSPLVIGVGDGEMVCASDLLPVIQYTRDVIFLEDGDCALVSKDSLRIENGEGPVVRAQQFVAYDPEAAKKTGFDHYMIKEIFEEPEAFSRTLAAMQDIEEMQTVLKGARGMTVVASGTSYHAGMIFRYLMEEFSELPVRTEIASEFRYVRPSPDEVVLVISQSGETADALAALRRAKFHRCRTVALTNTLGSSITREADHVFYTAAGPEISVAATKSFIAQLAALMKIVSLSQGAQCSLLLADVKQAIEAVLQLDVTKATDACAGASTLIAIGRGVFYPVALEAALKMKEISYIHAEGYAGGELKHGPFALLSEETPVVAFVPPGETRNLMLANLKEIASRQAPIIAIADPGDVDVADIAEVVIPVRHRNVFADVAAYTVAAQMLSYEVAKRLGRDIDKPRNLAKSVTVE